MAFKILVRLSESAKMDVNRGDRYVTGKTFTVGRGKAPLTVFRTLLRAAQRATK